jgi:branched-chain amino acid transport system permease protein
VEYYISVLNQALILAIFALSLNLVMGYAGQISMAHAVLGACGGYAAGFLSVHFGLGYVPGLAVGAVMALVVGAIISLPALRLDPEYLVLMTIALASAILAAVVALPWFGGTRTLLGVHEISIFGVNLDHSWQRLPVIAIPMIIVLLICWRLGESPFGRVLKGLREDATAVRALGKNPLRFHVITFAITSAMAGVAGTILVYDSQLVAANQFDFAVNQTIIIALVIGGMGNPFGAVIGAAIIAFFTPLFEQFVKLDPTFTHLLRLALYGVLLIAVLRLRPEGILPEGLRLRRRFKFADSLVAPGTTMNAKLLGEEETAPAVRPSLGGDFPAFSVALSTTTGNDSSIAATDSRADATAQDAFALAESKSPSRGDLSDAQIAAREWIVESQGLVKRFGGITAVNGLDLRLREGQITALVGPNGAGKTTVFNLLTGAIPADEGGVFLRGAKITGLGPDRVAALGMVRSFQDVRLIGRMTALQNVMLAVPHQPGESVGSLLFQPRKVNRFEKTAWQSAMRRLEFVGLAGDAHTLVSELGYGQQKLVSLARILATGADVLLLDEPASGIDQAWLEPTLQAILRLPEEGHTVLIVEHNLEVVSALATWVYFLEQGKVTAEGTMQELTQQERLAEVYFGRIQ